MRSPAKTLYVLLMTSILITGCLNSGSTADSDATTDGEHAVNSPPIIDAYLVDLNATYAIEQITTTTEETEDGTTTVVTTTENVSVITGYNLSLYHAMLDWDGSIDQAGWDLDLDGVIDVTVSDSTGVSVAFYALPELDGETEGLITVAFGAQDDDGSWSSGGMVTFNILADYWEDLALAPYTYSGSTRNSYTADDAAAGISTANTDTLMSIRWQHAEDDLNWAFVIIKLTIGDNTHDCGIDGTDNCAIGQDGDDAGLWQIGEFLTLSENDADICGGAGEVTCEVNVHVTYRGTVVAGTSDLAIS